MLSCALTMLQSLRWLMTRAWHTFIGPSHETTDTFRRSVIVTANVVTGTNDCAYRAVSALQPFPVTQATSDQCVQKVHVLHLKKKQDHTLSILHYSIVDNITTCGRKQTTQQDALCSKRECSPRLCLLNPWMGSSDTESKLIDWAYKKQGASDTQYHNDACLQAAHATACMCCHVCSDTPEVQWLRRLQASWAASY